MAMALCLALWGPHGGVIGGKPTVGLATGPGPTGSVKVARTDTKLRCAARGHYTGEIKWAARYLCGVWVLCVAHERAWLASQRAHWCMLGPPTLKERGPTSIQQLLARGVPQGCMRKKWSQPHHFLHHGCMYNETKQIVYYVIKVIFYAPQLFL